MSPSDIIYIYDELERLAGVVAPGGDTAIYVYDLVGNLLSIKRHSSSIVSLIEFIPKNAPVGTSLTIHGTGFSTTPSQNDVAFNSVPATVVSATGTEIVVTVPSGVVSGPITIATPTGSATSRIPFTVTDGLDAPTIAGFSPNIGTLDTPVAITGTGFEATLANNKVIFHRKLAVLRSASGTLIETKIPPGVGSGRIAVSTPFGRVISSDDFFIPPSPRTAADVAFTGRIGLRESKAVSINVANKIALVVFDATAGERVSAVVSGLSFGTEAGLVLVSILRPDGTILADKVMLDTVDDIDTEPLPETGTYTIVIDPGGVTVSLQLSLFAPVISTIAIDGPSVPVTIENPGQDAVITFQGSAGQRLDLGVSDVNFGPGVGFGAVVSIVHPDGTVLTSKIVSTLGMGIHTEPLPKTGIYTILIAPENAATVSLRSTLSETLAGSLGIDGPPVPVALRPGQNARLTFDGTAGQRINLGVTEVSFGTGNHIVISLLKPDGTALVSTTVGTNGGDIDTDPLPETGTYTIVVDPQGGIFNPGATTARLTVTVSEPIVGTIRRGGPSVPLALKRPGQDARLTFEGTAGQRISLSVSEVNFDIGGAVTGGKVSILRPDGTTLASTGISTGGSVIDTVPLPVTGIYTILVSPPGVLTVSLVLTLT